MKLRESNLTKLQRENFDVIILGGGINGAVAASALSAKGAKVALIDKGDFASFTSQNSSNLAWGGIKYMETFEFGLVRKLCMSRNKLMRNYPSTVEEIRFFTTITKGFRHGVLKLYAGTLFYWLMGNFFTKPPRFLTKNRMSQEEDIINLENAVGGFEYSDAYLHDNDARFVFLFIRAALNYGCIAANYVESLGASKAGDVWNVKAKDVISGKTFTIRGKVLINACGPFVDEHNGLTNQKTNHRHVFSKGIHLIVERLTEVKHILTFFADDGRLFFVIPMGNRTCIGTTDTQVTSPYAEVTKEDREFVLENINKRVKLTHPLTANDIIAERCGVRPLVVTNSGDQTADWVKLSRKHEVEVNKVDKHISIFGGKLTDCINVGDEVADYVKELGIEFPYFDQKWYGEPSEPVKTEFLHQAKLMGLDAMTHSDSSEPLSKRLWRRYGSQALGILDDIRENPERARILIEGTEYIRAELEEAARREMITKLEDFLRRRAKISLVVKKDDLKKSTGLKEACKILFGSDADKKWKEYFG
jgi:glycerol-3-phosphate dehydrogenase